MPTPYPHIFENKFIGALALENVFPRRFRNSIARVLDKMVLVNLALIFYSLLARQVAGTHAYGIEIRLPTEIPGIDQNFLIGALFLLTAPRLLLGALDGFFNSKTADKPGEAPHSNILCRLNLYAAQVWYRASSPAGTITLSRLFETLPRTDIGQELIWRLGVENEEYKNLLQTIISAGDVDGNINTLLGYLEKNIDADKDITFANLMTALFETSKPFRDYLMANGVTPVTLRGAAEWQEEKFSQGDAKRRWWTRVRLGRIPGFAKDWAYGHTAFLEKFARDLAYEALGAEEEIIGHDREIKLLESSLLKKSGANLVLVGEPGTGKRTILLGLTRMITHGNIFPELEHKRILELFGSGVVASGKTKGETESLLLRLLNEAVKAGNIILAIDEFPEFTASLTALGISANELLQPYLRSSDIHIIALADTLPFRRILETNKGLMEHFSKIEIAEPAGNALFKILEDIIPATEASRGGKIIFTYPALEKIGEGATNFLVTGAMPKRAVDLLEEVANEAVAQKIFMVGPELVLAILERKTKMPLGEITGEEKEKLLALEDILHKRVIDQEMAIQAIADAVRRARAGTRNPKRPIGTFLFLGPTGVGKTETAKALAESYFGNEEATVRLDMTEFQTDEDVTRLLGSFEKNEPGILASKIRSYPYGVVLLDEFEKSNLKVKNLFLQVLDEGFFSDYLGERVNMRNTIIIATSNAGSQLIWELTNRGEDPSSMERQIIEYIQKEKIMSPELLNRFDAVIIFRPLGKEVLQKIARLMLEKLTSRLKSQNIILKITDGLVDAAAKGGYDPAFGARPMQRFIQDKIEKEIADKIIKGEIKPGSEFSLSSEDLK